MKTNTNRRAKATPARDGYQLFRERLLKQCMQECQVERRAAEAEDVFRRFPEVFVSEELRQRARLEGAAYAVAVVACRKYSS